MNKKHKRLLLFILIPACLIILSLGGAAARATSLAAEEEEESELSIQDYRDQLEAINNHLEELEDGIAGQKTLVAGLEADIASLDAQLITVNQQLSLTQQQIDLTEGEITALEEEIVRLQQQLEQRVAILEQRLTDLYMYGDVSLLDVVFESSSFQDFITLFDLVELLVANDRDLAAAIGEERAAIEQDKEELETALADLQQVKEDYYDMASNLKRLEEQKAAAISEANMTISQYEAVYASETAMAEQASDKIRELMASSQVNISFGGYMIWPLPAAFGTDYVTSEYGWREHPVYGGQRFHSGIDIGADGGTSIFAAADGKIILEEYYGGYGYCIMIDHGSGVVSLYGHMSGFGSFSCGEYVVAGDTIGYVGTTGTSTGNHLHFETRYYGEYASPWDYLY